MISRVTATVFVSLVALATPLDAVADDRSEGERWMALRLTESGFGRQFSTKDDVRKRLMVQFNSADADGSGSVNQADADTAQRVRIAQNRAQTIGRMLRNDLDGDGRVTRAEVMAAHVQQANRPLFSEGISLEPTPEQKAELVKQIVAREMKADGDGDGVIVWAEMLAQANDGAQRNASYVRRPSLPPSLDGNGDGAISKAEFATFFDRAFDSADSNRDGHLSPDERTALRVRNTELRRLDREAERRHRVRPVRVPEPSASHSRITRDRF